MKEMLYELLKDNQEKQLGKNNKAKMTLYNALPRKEYERVFMCKTAKEVWHTLIITHQGNSQVKNCKIDLLTQEYERSGLLEQESREKVSSCFTIEIESQVYEMILASDGVASKPIKEKIMPVALKANVTRGQTSNDSVCQDRSNEDEDKKEEFNSIVKNLWKLFKKGNRFERENRFGNGGDRFDRGHGNRSKDVGSSRGKCNCYGCGSKNHFVHNCSNAKMKKEFFGGAWSDSEDGEQMEKDATCLMANGSQKIMLALNAIELLKLDFTVRNYVKGMESQAHRKGDPLGPWIPALEQRGAMI
ncbi:hypothetical protein Tco_0585447 [Tanacetum coccineum]